jgi:EAL domain-containing protein (putative c-di-GMP-specific phosphodiesterase class I)
VFEVAESTAERSLRDMFAFLRGIKVLGCGFCIDRFGRGADSLGLLKNLGADYVKLDMYFVNSLAKDSKKQAQLKELVKESGSAGRSHDRWRGGGCAGHAHSLVAGRRSDPGLFPAAPLP